MGLALKSHSGLVPAGKEEHDVGRAEGTVGVELLNYTPTRVEEDSNPQGDSRAAVGISGHWKGRWGRLEVPPLGFSESFLPRQQP